MGVINCASFSVSVGEWSSTSSIINFKVLSEVGSGGSVRSEALSSRRLGRLRFLARLSDLEKRCSTLVGVKGLWEAGDTRWSREASDVDLLTAKGSVLRKAGLLRARAVGARLLR
jgi:hypothetical protein